MVECGIIISSNKGGIMKFAISRLEVTIEMKPSNPFKMSRRARRRLAEQVQAWSSKFLRIKAIREISIAKGWHDTHNFGLKDAKDFVEEAFADNGHGSIVVYRK